MLMQSYRVYIGFIRERGHHN